MFYKVRLNCKNQFKSRVRYQSCIISFGTASRLKSWIKSLTVMLSFINWKVKKFSFLHYSLDLFLLIDLQTAIPSLQIKECNMHHTSRKDDEGELTCFWIFSLLLSTFLIISDTTHTEEVRPKRNSRSKILRLSVWKTFCSGGK